MRRALGERSGFDAPLLDEAAIAALISPAAPARAGQARRPPGSGRSGEQLSPRRGAGTDFAEVRGYYAGDDPRRIDWRASARAAAPLVRSYHAEFSRPHCLLIDRRAGMRFGTRVRLKVTQAVRVALRLAAAEARGGGEFAAVLLDAPCQWLPAGRGADALRRLVAQAVAPCPPRDPAILRDGVAEPTWDRILSGLRRRLPRGSELTLISDFAGLDDGHRSLLGALGRHCDCRAVRIVDPLEVDDVPAVALQACWGDDCRTLDLADPAVGAAWRERQRARSASLSDGFRRAGFLEHVLMSDCALPAALGGEPGDTRPGGVR